jgi:competence protein ComEA
VLADGRVVLNLASEADLTTLPGIGPSRARAILLLRQRLQKFRAVEDLLRVKGIGRKTLQRLRPNVVLDRPPAVSSAVSAPPSA